MKALRRLRHELSLLAGTGEDTSSDLALQYTAAEDTTKGYKGMAADNFLYTLLHSFRLFPDDKHWINSATI